MLNIPAKSTTGSRLARTIATAFWGASLFATPHIHNHKETFTSNGRKITLDYQYLPQVSPTSAAIVFLHGSGGSTSAHLPYRKYEQDLALQGYRVYIPHYFDSIGGDAHDSPNTFPSLVQVIQDAITYITGNTGLPKSKIALVGYSLGASVALAVATKEPSLAAVVDLSGSMPDRYLPGLTTLPPVLIIHGQQDSSIPVFNAIQLSKLCELRHFVCQTRLYPNEGHFFSASGIADSKLQVVRHLTNESATPTMTPT